MGATFPSTVLEESKDVVLHYPGLTFIFKYERAFDQDIDSAVAAAKLWKVATYERDELN